MKSITHILVALFTTTSLFAQVKTPVTKSDSIRATKPTHKTNSAIRPSVAEVVQSIESKMVLIQGGTFTMGCANEQDTGCYYWEKPAHKVSISSFYMAKFVVTQREWQAIVGTTPWWSKNCEECPVENVSWYDAQIFINMLNQLTGKYYRLPTEAEWEFAAGGGSKSKGYKYPGGNNPMSVAWYDTNSLKQTHPVGQKQPNEVGLYDMGGNVWQWCQDWFDDKYYSNSPANNPQGPGKDSYRAVRGGSWWSEVKDCRVVNRDRYPPDARDDDVGFRLARD